MKKYLLTLLSLFTLSEANITKFITFDDWTKREKIEFTNNCLMSEHIKRLNIHQGEMECVIIANKIVASYPYYKNLAQLDPQEFNKILSQY